jgi:hypothetical protein
MKTLILIATAVVVFTAPAMAAQKKPHTAGASQAALTAQASAKSEASVFYGGNNTMRNEPVSGNYPAAARSNASAMEIQRDRDYLGFQDQFLPAD